MSSSNRVRGCTVGSRRRYASIDSSIRSIPFSSIDVDRWKALYANQRPVLLKGYAATWPALRKWELPSLHKRLQEDPAEDSIVTVEFGANYMDANIEKLQVSFRSLISHILQSGDQASDVSLPNFYLAQFSLNEIIAIREDVPNCLDECSLSGKGHLYGRNIWLGGRKGTNSPCHYDPFNNILVQVLGRKQVVLFASTVVYVQYILP